MLEFQEVSETAQQSSRVDKVSRQQASDIGRLILAFANTPLQYARETRKATSDLVNRRGDWKTNISKILLLWCCSKCYIYSTATRFIFFNIK